MLSILIPACLLLLLPLLSSAQQDPANPDEELTVLLPGFHAESGIRAGEIYDPNPPPEVREITLANGTVSEEEFEVEPAELPVLIMGDGRGNRSEFTVCLRFRLHYQRPEYVLVAAYKENKTAVIIGEFKSRFLRSCIKYTPQRTYCV